MRERTRMIERAGISRDRYMELKYVARQYDAMKRDKKRFAARIYAIEQAAIAAAGDVVAPYVLQNVCRGVIYEHMDVPCGRGYFFAARRRFFAELDKWIN